jgi:hypothetical protein
MDPHCNIAEFGEILQLPARPEKEETRKAPKGSRWH